MATAVAIALAILAFVLGAALAVPIVLSVAEYVGVDELILARGARDLLLVRARFGVACALPPVIAWIAALVHRVRGRTDPSAIALSAYLAVPLIGGAAATLCQVLAWRSMNLSEVAGLRTLVTFSALTPDAALTYAPLAGVALWAVVFVRARRARTSSSV